VFPSTTIVQTVNRSGRDGYRPDITVSCSPANIGKREFITEPRIVVEVVSPSNAGPRWDLKLFEYWNTDSIEQLVLIGSLTREIVCLLRGENGQWLPPVTMSDDGILAFSPIGVTMTFAQIYRNTSLAL
jgi:Uma2 family endonuclease